MSLTDDWEAGKLNSGWYFCLCGKDAVLPLLYFDGEFGHDEPEIMEVLAPCDYDYISELQSKNKHLLDLQANQDKEVEKLRELLEECKTSVLFNSDVTRGLEGKNSSNYKNLLNLLTRINEVLGNDK